MHSYFNWIFLESLEILNLLAFRSVSSFSHEGSSLFVRLYPATLAIKQLEINGLASFFPMGAGYFENSPIVTRDEFSYGGTGSSKALVDLGIVFFDCYNRDLSYRFAGRV